MIRITIETVPEASMVPRGPARRECDMLVPQAMMEPTVVYQQSWVDGTPQPNLEELIGHLNHLQLPEVCSDCGHERALHVGETGECSQDHAIDPYNRRACQCKQYMTKQMKANRGAVVAAQQANEKLEQATDLAVRAQQKLEGEQLRVQNLQKSQRLSKTSIEELEEKLRKARKRIRGLK